MARVYFHDIKKEMKGGRVVVVEFKQGLRKLRAIVQQVDTKSESVETMYGKVKPDEIYSFKKAVEAQKYLNEVSN